MNSFNSLIKIFSDFPGIGPRQAKRFVYFLLTRNRSYIEEFRNLLEELMAEIKTCSSCFRYFQRNADDSSMCPICKDSSRDKTKLLVIARDVDLENIEKTHTYEGLYFVLGGTVPILEKEPNKKIRIDALKKHIKNEPTIQEVIVAMNANPEGENTEDYVRNELKKEFTHITVSTLGRGLSTGVELEYSDSDTLKNALSNRH